MNSGPDSKPTSDHNENEPPEAPKQNGEPSESLRDQPTNKPESDHSRRNFIKIAGGGIAATIAGGLAAPLASPILTALSADHVRLAGTRVDCGPIDGFTLTPKRVEVIAAKYDAWTGTKPQVVGSVYVRRKESTAAPDKDSKPEFEAFSSICPHTSCSVTFLDQEQRFLCPCHKTYFSVEGSKLEGPSKRGLDTLPCQVEDGRVIVTYLRFKPGIAAKEQV